MLFPGTCPKCRARAMCVEEWDKKAKGTRRSCVVCGYTYCWKNPNGTVYNPPPWKDHHLVADQYLFARYFDGTDRYREVDPVVGREGLLKP